MVARSLSFALVLLIAAEGVARADERAERHREVAEQIGRGIVRQARRAIAIGPTVGVFSAYAPSASDFEGGLSFGLEGQLFKTMILSPGDLQELVRQKAKAKLTRLVTERHGGVEPDAATMSRLVQEVLEEVKAELIAELGASPRKLERPRFHLHLEANYLFSSQDWLARLGFGIGIGPVSLGPSLSARFGDDTVAQLGGELSIHLLPTRSLRSPVFDVFVRGDFELHARDSSDDQIVLGVRLLLDLI